MKHILAENLHGTSPIRHTKLYHNVHRFLRPDVGRATLPFDWNVGITNRPVYNIKNQYQSSSCWGQMFSRMVQIIRGQLGIEVPSPELSAKSAYSPIYVTGGGVNLPDGENEAKNIGLTTEANVASVTHNVNGDTCTESFMEMTDWRTLPLTQDALTRANLQVVNVDMNIDAIAEAIRDYGCVGFLVRGQNNGTWTGVEPTPPNGGGQLWGHFVCSDSNVPPAINGKKRIKFYNSWGTVGVGENGFQYFDEVYIESGFIADCFTFIVAQPTTKSWWANFLNLLGWLKNHPAPKVV